MRLATKLVVVFLIGIVVLTGVNIFLALRHEEREFENETTAEARRLAKTMEEVLTVVWRDQGQAGAVQLIQRTSDREPHLQVRWVYFDASPGGDSSTRNTSTLRSESTAMRSGFAMPA
jgi:hypothetical protein